MKNSTLAAALSLVALWAAPTSAASGLAIADTLLRTGPGPSFPPAGTVPARAVLDVIGCSDWCKVEYRGRVGWMPRTYVSASGQAPRTGNPVIAVVPNPATTAGGPGDLGSPVGWYAPRRGADAVRVYEDWNGRTYYERRGRRAYVSPRDVAETRREAEAVGDQRERRRDEYRDRVEERGGRWERPRDPPWDRLESERDHMEERRDRDEWSRDLMEDEVFGRSPYR